MHLGGLDSKFTIMAVLIVVMVIRPTEAIANPGLSWGVEIGNRIDYHLAIRYTEASRNDDLNYYIVVDSLPTIPNNITEPPYIGSSSANEWNTYFSFYFMNGTEITPQTSVPNLHWSAYPIGNWSLVEELAISDINTTYWEVQNIDTETEWGLIITADEVLAIHTDTVRYSKEDGALTFLEMRWQYDPGRFRILRYTRVGEGFPVLLVAGVGVVSFGLLVIALVILKKRSQISLSRSERVMIP
ncbi:MAG: hypothetical protein ACFFEK_10905 [Candidatus Thorarchaeota archaeon]